MGRKKRKFHPLDAVKYSPYRPVRWRYDRVLDLLEGPGSRRRMPTTPSDDEWITEAYAFMRKWDKFGQLDSQEETEERRRGLVNQNFFMYQAYEVASKDDGDKMKGEIEARILANQTNSDIAAKIGMFPDSIEWYERVFFNVRDRLNNSGYIISNVIGPLVSAGFESATVEMSAKFFGYVYRNEQLVEQLLTGINTHISPPGEGQDTLAFLDATVENMVETLVLRTAQIMQPNKFDAKELLIVWKDLMSLRRQASGADMSRTNIEENVSAFLGSISWAVGRDRQQLLDAGPLAGYADKDAELRAGEQVAIMAGTSQGDSEKEVITRKLPPPRKAKIFDREGGASTTRGSEE